MPKQDQQHFLKPKKLPHRYVIGVVISDEAGGETEQAQKMAFNLGAALAKLDTVAVTNSFVGLGYVVAQAVKSQHGTVIGYAQAASAREHSREHKLPTDAWDVVVYCGRDFASCNEMLLQSVDALIVMLGDANVLPLTNAISEELLVGFLANGASDELMVEKLAETLGLRVENTLFDIKAEKLLSRLAQRLKSRRL